MEVMSPVTVSPHWRMTQISDVNTELVLMLRTSSQPHQLYFLEIIFYFYRRNLFHFSSYLRETSQVFLISLEAPEPIRWGMID